MQLPASPADSGFLPRREFATSNRPPNSFALVTFTHGSNIRLAAFPDEVVISFHKFLDDKELVRLFRENRDEEVAEFVLNNKFWTNPKNIETEQLLLSVMNFFNLQGYTFLSSIDYGRDAGDKLTFTFTRPQGVPPTVQQLVFAVSFNSATSLRVLNPPLQSTPGILAAVRTAWPRGIVSENRAAVSCYEFKLKGYSFFDEDTFQSDALQHILSLLKAFDKYGFTLLTSLSFANTRSRVKDLWIFSTPEVDSDTISPATLLTPGGGYANGNGMKLPGSQTSLPRSNPSHFRSASEQPPYPPFAPSHTRNASVPPLNTPKSGNTLLKKSPQPTANHLPTVSDNSPPVSPPYYGTASKSSPLKPPNPTLRTNLPPQILYATPTPASETVGGLPRELFFTSTPSQPPPPLPRGPLHVANAGPDETDSIIAPPLLSANAFRDTSIGDDIHEQGEAARDSAFSTMSGDSFDVPVVWTGGLPTMEEESVLSGRESGSDARQTYATTEPDRSFSPITNTDSRPYSPNPTVPGSWLDTDARDDRPPSIPPPPRVALPPPAPINLPTKIDRPHVTIAESAMRRPTRDSADAVLTRGWVLVNVTSSPGFDRAPFDSGLSEPMPSIPALPTPGVETPYSNGGPVAPPVAPKPKPKPRPRFNGGGSGEGSGGGSDFGSPQSPPLNGSLGRSYGMRGGSTGKPSPGAGAREQPERPPILPSHQPVSKGSFRKMFTRSNSKNSRKQSEDNEEKGGGLAAGTGHWAPGSTLGNYPAPYHSQLNASF